MYHFLTTQFPPPPNPTSRLEPGIRDREVGAERAMIGSDYCFDMGITQPVQVVEAQLRASRRKMVLGGTTAAF